MDFIDKMFNGQRYGSLKSGYKFDRLIFTVGMYAIFAFLIFTAYSYNFHLTFTDPNPYTNYYKCTEPPLGSEVCRNPFYKPTSWVNAEYLAPGEYGFKPGILFYSIKYITVGVFALMFLLNHLFHNKGKNPFKGLKIDTEV